MKNLKELLKAIENDKAVSAWNKGVRKYAYELIEELDNNNNLYQFAGSPADIKELLNGAEDWQEYSEGGCSLIYNQDIAERLCTPSELKATKNGQRNPNKNENWIDCQTRALYQAERLIKRLCK